jgi:hypothetical protein
MKPAVLVLALSAGAASAASAAGSVASLCAAGAPKSVTAEMLVFSGTANPSVTLNATAASDLCAALTKTDEPAATPTCRVLGFTGFAVRGADAHVALVVRGHSAADDLLMAAFEDVVSPAVLTHAREESQRLVNSEGVGAKCADADTTASPKQSFADKCSTGTPKGSDPIRGEDTPPPVYDPDHDNKGCYATADGCQYNNCYDYGWFVLPLDTATCSGAGVVCGLYVLLATAVPSLLYSLACPSPHRHPQPLFGRCTMLVALPPSPLSLAQRLRLVASDIVTNTFSQPGDGSGKKWTDNTCDAIRIAATADGLVYIPDTANKPPPTSQPDEGHIVSMHIWPETNFHWVRMDRNLTFSHKPGSTPVRDVDNDGNVITDPSKSNFAPWTEHCGYFTIVPSKVTIIGER